MLFARFPVNSGCQILIDGSTPRRKLLRSQVKPYLGPTNRPGSTRIARCRRSENCVGNGLLMQVLSDLRDLTPNQRNAVLASFLGWTLDAFDFFIIVFVLKDIAAEFKADIPAVTATLFLTLAMRPVGAFLFGMVADR